MRWRSEIGLIYVIGLVQGLALVTFPAASSIFTSSLGFGFSASRYGMMFIPQVALAILASSLGPQPCAPLDAQAGSSGRLEPPTCWP